MKILKSCIAFTLLIISQGSIAQVENDYAKLLNDPSSNYFEIKSAFENFYKNKDVKEKGKGWKAFKRWEEFYTKRMDANGKIQNLSSTYEEYLKARETSAQAQKTNGLNQYQASGTWNYLGPNNGVPTNGGGAGRITFVEFDPNNPNTLYAGTPAGGLWKSINGGLNWTTNTDQLASIGISALAIDPNNSNIMYIGTGDKDAGDTYGVGVLKSIDGGLTWGTTGLSAQVQQQKTVNALLISPTNSNVIIAASSNGIYKSYDSGVSWQLKKSGGVKELKTKPGDPNTIYACNSSFLKSIDFGETWTYSTGLSIGVSRLAMAVTAADPSYVYIIAGQDASWSYGFEGLYLSTNSGQSFTQISNSPNILGWDENGNDSGGQAWYDLCIAANPTNKNEIVTGGVNVWRSTDGGASWGIDAHWYGAAGNPYVHADAHWITYYPGSSNTIFVGCDGGVFKTTDNGVTWNDLSDGGLQIGQMYKLGVSQSNSALTMTGWQDNGSSLHNGNNANVVLGGDGMECAIDHSNASTMYGEYYYGYIEKSTNGGSLFSPIVLSGGSGVDEDGAWVTPFVLDPTNANTMIVGKKQLYMSTNAGNSFTQLGAAGNGGNFNAIAIAPSNSNYIYATRSGDFHASTNGGSSFTNLSLNLPQGSISYICIDPTNPLKVWYTVSGYTAGKKVYASTDGGISWTNISFNLPNLPANCIAFSPGSNDGLYVGTDIGVYYKDATLPGWIFYSYGLPNVIVSELEVQASTSKLRAATYGRGLWETDLYTPPSIKPVANYYANDTTVCVGTQVNFVDASTNLPSIWNWSFPGATPSTSSLQSPSVNYSSPGLYTTKLIVSSVAGIDSLEKTAYINVIALPTANAGSDTSKCSAATVQLNASGGGMYSWLPNLGLNNPGISNPICNTLVSRTYTLTVTDVNGCSHSDVLVVNVQNAPSTLYIMNSNNVLTAMPSGFGYTWYLNGSIISGVTTQTITATSTGTYSVALNDTVGCGYTGSATFNVVGIHENVVASSIINLFPNPNSGSFKLDIANLESGSYSAFIQNALGQIIYSSSFVKGNKEAKKEFELNLNNGVYHLVLINDENLNTYRTKFVINKN